MVVASRFGWGFREAAALCAAGRRLRRVVVAAVRFSGEVTTTDGSDCDAEPEFDCANDTCGDKANTDTVANAATRNKSQDFKASPQPCEHLSRFQETWQRNPSGTHTRGTMISLIERFLEPLLESFQKRMQELLNAATTRIG